MEFSEIDTVELLNNYAIDCVEFEDIKNIVLRRYYDGRKVCETEEERKRLEEEISHLRAVESSLHDVVGYLLYTEVIKRDLVKKIYRLYWYI